MGEQSTIYENRDSKEILKDKLISPSGTLADFFEISDKAREGGMGEVFFCRDKRDNKFYVLKTIKADIDSKIFKEEAAFSLKLNKNPYVAYTRTIVIEKDILYIVMDYIGKQPYTLDSIVEGETLTKVMNKYHIEPKQALIWAIQFCKGMDFLNKSGMKVHKDIKPDNILISPDNVVKIIDFGLASIEKKGGTPGYRPPEYFDDKKDLTIQSDIYSFGLVLYQMLNNGKLLSDTTKFDKEKKEYEFFDYKNITSKHCQDIIKKCLQIKPRDRYKDFKALEKDLTKYLNKNYPEYKFEDIPAEAMTSQDYFLKGFGLYILYELYGSHPILDIRNQELRFPQEDLYPYFTNSIKLDSHNASAYFYRNLIHQHTGMLPHANILHQDERGAKLQINIDQPGLDTFKGAILNPTYAKYFIKRYTKENTYAYDSYTSIRSEVKLYYFILKVYDIILKTNSKDGECYYLKAKIKNELLKLNLYSSSEVIEDLNKAIKYGFNTIDAMRLKADLLKKDKDYKNAIKCYRKIFELAYKQNPYLMLIVLLKNRNHDIYEVASCYRNIGQYSFIKKFLNKIFAIDKNKYLKIKKDIISFWTYKSAMAKAELYRKQGNINNQIKSYKLALKQHINKSLYNFNRFKAEYLLKVLKTNTASAYNEYGLFSSGLYFIEMNDPGEDWGKGSQFLDSLNNYRIDIFNKEKAEESIQYFNKAIEIDPNYAFAYYNRADMFLFLKKYEKAIRDYNKAIQLAPNLAKTIGIRGTNEIYNHLRGNYGYASGILFSPSRVRSKSHQKMKKIEPKVVYGQQPPSDGN